MRGLNQPELSRVLSSPKFAERVSTLARYTYATESEGGFCVYKNTETDKLSISQPDLPTSDEREQWRKDHNCINSIYNHLDEETAKGTFKSSKLFYNSSYRQRRDIAIFIHSHPGGSDFLVPSNADLEVYEEQNGLNPNIINGILVASQIRARIFLYGQTAMRYASGQYQVINPDYMGAQNARVMLAEDGFCTAIAVYDTTSSRIISQPKKVAENYFNHK